MPQFSIIIPTHNRSQLLQYALQSAVNQKFADFEIIVSDDQSTDDTPEVVERMGESRVRYLRTPRRMSMPDHFEWASEQATGDFLMFLCDDDAIAPELLGRVNEVVEKTDCQVVALTSGSYYHPDWNKSSYKNVLNFNKYTPSYVICDSQKVIEEFFRVNYIWATPRSNNSFCHRNVIEKVRNEVGRFFLYPAPDASSCCLTLSTVPKYALLTDIMHLWGSSAVSIGADQEYNRGAASEEFKRINGRELFQLSPLKIYTVTNIVVESFLQARAHKPDKFPELDLEALYRKCLQDVKKLEIGGANVGEDFIELEEFRIRHGIKEKPVRQTEKLRRSLSSSVFGNLIRKVKHTISPAVIPIAETGSVTIHGKDTGFSNILECSSQLSKLTN